MSTQTVTRPPAGQAGEGVRQPARRSPRMSMRAWRIARLVVTVALALVWLAPMLWAVDTALKPEGETTAIPISWIPESGFTLDAFRFVLDIGDIPKWFVNTFIVTFVVTALTVLTASMAGYGFSRFQFRGRGVLFGLILAGIMVPPQILIVPLFDQMLSLGLVDTYWAIILPQVAIPAMVFIMKRFFDGLPRDMEDAALVDGASHWRIYWQIAIPLSRSVIAAVAVFVWVHTWNNFLWPFIVTSDPNVMTLPVGLAQVESEYGLQYARIMASSVAAGIFLVAVFAFIQKQLIRGIAHTGLGGR